MPERYEDKSVKCPFYRKTAANKIVCDGFANGMTVHLAFESDMHRKLYIGSVCGDIKVYRLCPICKMLYKIYEELDGNE